MKMEQPSMICLGRTPGGDYRIINVDEEGNVIVSRNDVIGFLNDAIHANDKDIAIKNPMMRISFNYKVGNKNRESLATVKSIRMEIEQDEPMDFRKGTMIKII